MAWVPSATGACAVTKGVIMDYKAEILELVQLIENKKLLRFIYYMIDDLIGRYSIIETGKKTGVSE